MDDLSGNAIATVWNFAIHGVCYGPDNMQYSADIMGYVNNLVEASLGMLNNLDCLTTGGISRFGNRLFS